ncbi:integral membrane protein [Histoplasma ohiense]|nr:integral membrane protein [Histoplasma ohiense (nom. inval.)]
MVCPYVQPKLCQPWKWHKSYSGRNVCCQRYLWTRPNESPDRHVVCQRYMVWDGNLASCDSCMCRFHDPAGIRPTLATSPSHPCTRGRPSRQKFTVHHGQRYSHRLQLFPPANCIIIYVPASSY